MGIRVRLVQLGPSLAVLDTRPRSPLGSTLQQLLISVASAPPSLLPSAGLSLVVSVLGARSCQFLWLLLPSYWGCCTFALCLSLALTVLTASGCHAAVCFFCCRFSGQ